MKPRLKPHAARHPRPCSFANTFFAPNWNRNSIANVQITFKEVGGRVGQEELVRALPPGKAGRGDAGYGGVGRQGAGLFRARPLLLCNQPARLAANAAV